MSVATLLVALIAGEARAADAPPSPPSEAVAALFNERGVLCSGALIGPRLILSARHCHGVKYARLPSSTAAGAISVHAIERKLVPKSTAIDVAIFVLEEASDTTPVALYTRHVAPRAQVYAQGFGRDAETGEVHGLKTLALQMQGWNCEGDRALHYGCASDSEFVISRNLERLDTCSGDSGGPVFVYVDGSWQVVGVTSRSVTNAVRVCGDGGVYSRVDVLVPWIKNMQRRFAPRESKQ